MKHLQAITPIKPHVRFYSSTLEAVGCQPSVSSGRLECALLPARLHTCGGFFFLLFWCRDCIQFTFNSIFVAACARCLQGKRGERRGVRLMVSADVARADMSRLINLECIACRPACDAIRHRFSKAAVHTLPPILESVNNT